MQKNELMKHEGIIKRILELKEDKVLAIDCMQKSMPKWMNQTDIVHGENCTEEELLQITDMTLADMETLDMASRKTAQERYTLIAGILPFIGNKKVRNQLIDKAAIENSISKQTIRAYLCLLYTSPSPRD